MTKFKLLAITTLGLCLGEAASAIPSSFTHLTYSCKMACGELSVGGGNCRGLQVSGEINQDAAGGWNGKHSEFEFSPDMMEYLAGLSSCVADFTAKISVISADALHISFGQGIYQVPQTCRGGVLTDPNPTIIPAFTIFAHSKPGTATSFSATASVPRRTSWPQVDLYPDCEISFK